MFLKKIFGRKRKEKKTNLLNFAFVFFLVICDKGLRLTTPINCDGKSGKGKGKK